MGLGAGGGIRQIERDGRTESATDTAIRGGAVRVAGYAAGVLVSLGTATILLRHLGIPEFGRYVTITSLIALVGGVTEAGIIVYGIREFADRDERARRDLIANLLAMRLALSSLGVVLAVVFGLAVDYAGVIVLGTVIAGAGLLAQVTSDVLSISLQAQLLLGRLTGAELVRRVLALGFIGALALLGAGLLPMVAATAVAGVLAMGVTAWMTRRYVAARLRFDFRVWRGLFDETLPYAIALSITGIYVYVTVVIMSVIASATQTGLFATSFRVTQVLLAVPSLLLTAVFPLLSRATREVLRDSLGRVLAVSLLCGAWLSLVLALGAGFIVEVLASTAGRGAAPVLRIHGVMLVATFVSTSSALVLVSLRRYRPLILTSVSVLIIDIGLAFALVPSLGAKGGALSDVLAEGLAAVGLTVAALRALPGARVSLSFVVPLALASVLAALIALAPIGELPRVIAASAIYFGVLAVTGAIPEQVTAALTRLGGRLRSSAG